MRLVIDIPEKMMSYINKNEFNAISEAAYGSMAMLAIKNGTPLPKGHGRLIDEQQIIDRFKPIERFKYWCVGLDGLFNILRYTPTIIEADKAESEECYDRQRKN